VPALVPLGMAPSTEAVTPPSPAPARSVRPCSGVRDIEKTLGISLNGRRRALEIYLSSPEARANCKIWLQSENADTPSSFGKVTLASQRKGDQEHQAPSKGSNNPFERER